MRTVTVDVQMRLLLKLDEGVEVSAAVNELDRTFKAPDGETRFEVVGDEMLDFEVIDSR